MGWDGMGQNCMVWCGSKFLVHGKLSPHPTDPLLPQVLMLSCVVAIGVNLSQFLCLGRFSATSFQVLGHAKTILVLFGGWAIFHETMNLKQFSGEIGIRLVIDACPLEALHESSMGGRQKWHLIGFFFVHPSLPQG